MINTCISISPKNHVLNFLRNYPIRPKSFLITIITISTHETWSSIKKIKQQSISLKYCKNNVYLPLNKKQNSDPTWDNHIPNTILIFLLQINLIMLCNLMREKRSSIGTCKFLHFCNPKRPFYLYFSLYCWFTNVSRRS